MPDDQPTPSADAVMAQLLSDQVLALVAAALQLEPAEAAFVDGVLDRIAGGTTTIEWPTVSAFLLACRRIATLTRAAYPSLEASPLGRGRPASAAIADLDPAIRTAYGEAIGVLRDADNEDFRRITNAGLAVEQQRGKSSNESRYVKSCGNLAHVVQQTRGRWS